MLRTRSYTHPCCPSSFLSRCEVVPDHATPLCSPPQEDGTASMNLDEQQWAALQVGDTCI